MKKRKMNVLENLYNVDAKKKKKEGSVPGEQQTIPILRTEAWTGLKQVFDTMK